MNAKKVEIINKKIILSAIIALLLCACFINVNISKASAASSYTKVDSGTVVVNPGKSAVIPYEISSKKHVMFIVEANTIPGNIKIKSGKFVIKIKKKSGKTIEKFSPSMKGVRPSDGWWAFCSTDKAVKKGSYYSTITNKTNVALSVKYTVRAYNKVASKASIKKKKSVYRGNWVKLGKVKSGVPAIKSVKSANKKIVGDTYYDYNGNIYVYGKNAGTTTVTTILDNGKKYTSKVTVKPQDPNVYACLYDYDTRDNYFTVKIKNEGDRTVTVIRSGGKVINVNYKSFDRRFKNSGAIKIKPGKTKYVRFYCKGSTTWNDYTEYTVYAKLRSEGRTYEWHVWDEDSVIKKGKKWYNSYYDEEDYMYWNPNLDYDNDEDYDDEDYDY